MLAVEAAHDRYADMADADGGIGQRWLLRDASRDGRPDRRAPEGERPLSPMDRERVGEGSALEMIAACFRHQHPEAFGGTPVPSPVLPVEVRSGREDMREPVSVQVIGEEVIRYPGAKIL